VIEAHDAEIAIPALGVTLSMADIYRRVDLNPA
jgi:hypothetical protein